MLKTAYKIIVQKPEKMRYATVGDYYKTKKGWVIESVDLKNPDYNFLTHLHEFIELYMTQRHGISEPEIKKFDEWFEEQKAKGNFKRITGPGNHPKAPYHHEHVLASKIERLIAKELKVNYQQQNKMEDRMYRKIKRLINKNNNKE